MDGWIDGSPDRRGAFLRWALLNFLVCFEIVQGVVSRFTRTGFSMDAVYMASLLCLMLLPMVVSGSGSNCTSSSPLVGLTAEIGMRQHQLRGQIHIVDDCSFRVAKFDMIAGQDVYWWGAQGQDFENLTNGFVISADKLNRTYRNETFIVTLANYTWDDIRVLGVWDRALDSDFGHVSLLPPNTSDLDTGLDISNGLSPAPSPQLSFPAPSPDSGSAVKWGIRQPTMFANCIVLTPNYRLRWTHDQESQTIDLGLEAAVTDMQYMAFGWANPGSTSYLMLHADVVVGGFKDRATPFVEDYYITKYSQCSWDKNTQAIGVCPDFLYLGSGNDSLVNNSMLVHGQRLDGVALIRYQRPLESSDLQFDVSINATDSMKVIWSVGPLKQPDSLRPLYLPGNHGGPMGVTYGHLDLNISDKIDQCTGPLEVSNQDEGDLIVADIRSPIVVTTGFAMHYPNPPNPDKVLLLKQLEAPVLKVERGVPVTFSIQAGHDVAFCITSDPVGGTFISNATVFAGGPDAHGVPASPYKLIWQPDRKTPDEVFYQSCFQKKMGWKVQVVDGGLSDMYNSSVFLADQMVTLFWTLTDSGIAFAVRGERKSGYVAIGFGDGMVNCFAYVGWMDGNGTCQVNTYWIDGKKASGVHPTKELLADVNCWQQKGVLTFEFSRPLQPACNVGGQCKKNIIDPSIPLKVVWAMGTLWKADRLTDQNMHSSMSSKYMSVHLTRGVAEAEQQLRPVLAVHGFMMFLAWGLLLPGGILAARYLKHLKDDGWFQIHVYTQYSGISVMLLGLLFAVAELRRLYTNPLHVKFGIMSILLACAQTVIAFFRPKKISSGQKPLRRVIWELVHRYNGRIVLVVGFISLLTGISDLGAKYGGEQKKGLDWALVGWFLCIAVLVCYLEFLEAKGKRKHGGLTISKGNWVMANNEDDDSSELLQSNHMASLERDHNEMSYPSRGMEVQLEALR